MKKRIVSLLVLVGILLSVYFAFAGSVTTSGITAQTIINAARRDLAEEGYSNQFWKDSDFIQWIDQAVKDINFKTKCLESGSSTVVIRNNTWTYSISSTFTDIEAALYDSGVTNVTQPQVFALERAQIKDIGHTKEKGAPKLYCIWNNQFLIWPIPDSTVAGTSLYLYMTAQPSGVTVATSAIETPFFFDDAILFFVKAKAFYKDSKIASGDYHMRLYNAKLDEYLAKIIKRNP